MTPFKKGIYLTFAGVFVVGGISTIAYPQGATTLVQIIMAGAPVSSTNPLQVTGSLSATTTGFPGTTQTTGTPISVTTGGVTGTLPSGAVVVASNVGATNNAYCKLGASAATSDQMIPPNSWFGFTIGSNTQLTCITSTSTTTVNMVGGAGLPTGAGGGGGGSGAVAQSSITSGQTGVLIQGAVTTAAPSYSTAQTSPLSLDTAGNVRVTVTNTNANGQAIAANSSPVVLPAAQVTADPCTLGSKTNLPISQNGTSSVQLVALSGSTVIYVCSLSLVAAGATTAVITTGTGTACVTGNAAVIGDTTANIANGLSFAANGGLTLGNGAGTIAKGAASGELCMTLGTNVRMSGNLTYVQQ